jgi:hypothetical protein
MAIIKKDTADPYVKIVRFHAPIAEPMPSIPKSCGVIVMGVGTDADFKKVCDYYCNHRWVYMVTEQGVKSVIHSNDPRVDQGWRWA